MHGRYAHVRQHDPCDCGAAALATVALHHAVPIDFRQLRFHAGTDRNGTNFLGLVRAAQTIGFSARAVRGPFESLAEVPLPAIAHTEDEFGLGHFVVLHRADANSVVVADPAAQVMRLSKDLFCSTWTGCVLILQKARHSDANTPARSSVLSGSRRATNGSTATPVTSCSAQFLRK